MFVFTVSRSLGANTSIRRAEDLTQDRSVMSGAYLGFHSRLVSSQRRQILQIHHPRYGG